MVSVEESGAHLKRLAAGFAKTFEECEARLREAPARLSARHDRVRENVAAAQEAVVESFAEVRRALDAREAEVLMQLERELGCADTMDELAAELQAIADTLPGTSKQARELLAGWEGSALTAEKASVVVGLGKAARDAEALERRAEEECVQDIRVSTEGFATDMKGIAAAVAKVEPAVTVVRTATSPEGLCVSSIGATYVGLLWRREEGDTGYCVVAGKRRGNSNSNNSNSNSSNKGGQNRNTNGNGNRSGGWEWNEEGVYTGADSMCVVVQLAPGTEHAFRVKARRGQWAWSKWSEVAVAKTAGLTLETAVDDLQKSLGNSSMCASMCKALGSLFSKTHSTTSHAQRHKAHTTSSTMSQCHVHLNNRGKTN